MQSPKRFSQLIPITQSSSPIPFPTPPGPHKVGTHSLEATDTSRLDPFGPVPHHRRLMFTFFYPTSNDCSLPFAHYLPSARIYSDWDESDHLPYGTTARHQPQAHDGAPVLTSSDVRPLHVIIFSTGFGVMRESYTIMLENLASQGYFVVSIGHTYDTAICFPDGEIVWQFPTVADDFEVMAAVRAQDAQFTLSQLANPAFVTQIPGLAGSEALELSRVGMFGHSIGGAAALAAMVLDLRIAGGVNLDGAFQGDSMTVGTERPFLVISAVKEKDDEDKTLMKTWEHLTGWKAALEIEGATHMSFADMATTYKLLDVLDVLDPKKKNFGAIDPFRMMDLLSLYLKSFFDFVLKGGSDDVFKVPNQAFPETKILFKE